MLNLKEGSSQFQPDFLFFQVVKFDKHTFFENISSVEFGHKDKSKSWEKM